MEDSVVHVDLVQLARLADRLGSAAAVLDGLADRLAREVARSGVGAGPRRHLREVAAWAREERARLRVVLRRLELLEVDRGRGGGVAIVRGTHPAFVDPVRAFEAAERTVALLQAGTEEAAARAADLLLDHGGDPVFSATVLHGIGAAGVAAVLGRAARRQGESGPADGRLVAGLAGALATGLRIGVAPFGWTALLDAAEDGPAGPAAVGLLFLTPAAFPTAALVDAVRTIVVPMNRAVGGGDPSRAWVVGGGVAVDARAAVLGRVAGDPAAARVVLSTTDLGELLPASLGYADGGRAVADVVVAGTAPIDPVDGSVVTEPLVTGDDHAHRTSAANLVRVVDWMATSGPPPVEVERSTDRILRPWIGSVRGGGLGAGTTPHVVLDEGRVRRVLAAAMDHEGTRIGLGDAAWTWAAAESARLASGPVTGAGFDAIGSVVGIVSSEAQDARGRQAVTDDVERANARSLWLWAQGAVAKVLPAAGQAAVATIGEPVRDELLPATDLELDHWRQHRDLAVSHEALLLEHLLIATLWNLRDHNGYFDVDGGRPPPALLAPPGSADARLRPLVELDAEAIRAYHDWRSRLAHGRPAPVQLAAERYLAEGREVVS